MFSIIQLQMIDFERSTLDANNTSLGRWSGAVEKKSVKGAFTLLKTNACGYAYSESNVRSQMLCKTCDEIK